MKAWEIKRYLTCCLLMAGSSLSSCAGAPPPILVHEGAYDVVMLEPRSHEAQPRHPVSIESGVMAAVLRGLYIEQDERLLQRLLAGRTPPVAVFPDEESVVIARYLVQALAQATSAQQVSIRFKAPRSQGEEKTQAVLYCASPYLYFTLQQFDDGHSHDSDTKPGRQLPNSDQGSRRLVFHSPANESHLVERSSPMSLRINYVELERALSLRAAADEVSKAPLSSSSLTPAAPAAASEGREPSQGAPQTSSLNELIVRKDLEIESLKEDIRTLRHALEKQQSEVTRLKRLLDNRSNREGHGSGTGK
jgi:hypothetical protein